MRSSRSALCWLWSQELGKTGKMWTRRAFLQQQGAGQREEKRAAQRQNQSRAGGGLGLGRPGAPPNLSFGLLGERGAGRGPAEHRSFRRDRSRRSGVHLRCLRCLRFGRGEEARREGKDEPWSALSMPLNPSSSLALPSSLFFSLLFPSDQPLVVVSAATEPWELAPT